MEFLKRLVTSIGKNDDHLPLYHSTTVEEFLTICAQTNAVGLSEETKQNTRLIILHYLVHSKSRKHLNSGMIELEGLLESVSTNHTEINHIRYLHAVASYRLGDLDRCLSILQQIPADLADPVGAKVAVLKADAHKLMNNDGYPAGTVVVVAGVAVAGTLLAARYGFPFSDFLVKEGPEEFRQAIILKDLIEKRIAKNVLEGVSIGVSAITYAATSLKAAFITQTV